MPTKLEQLQLQFRQKLMQEKEERMIRIHTDSQQKALSKVNKYDNIQQIPNTISVAKKPPPVTYANQPHQSPIKKGSPGVDRSRPLPPLQKEQKNHYNTKTSPSSTPGESTKTVISNDSRSRSVDLEIRNMARPAVNGRLKHRTDSNRSLEVESYPRPADPIPDRMTTNVDYLARLKQTELQRIRTNGKVTVDNNSSRQTNGHYPTASSKSSIEQKSSPPMTIRQSPSRPKPPTRTPVVHKRSPPMRVNGNNNHPPPRKPPNPNQEQCKLCGRNFNKDRIDKHFTICSKTSQKKRKVFDVTKMRVQGTEAESFVKKGLPKKEQQPKPKKTDWKKQHEEFIATIRQAKVLQRHLAAGGKVSDLPPPPPSDTSHYVPCPHCGRKFDSGVADRHIPKCQNIRSNKKPARK